MITYIYIVSMLQEGEGLTLEILHDEHYTRETQ